MKGIDDMDYYESDKVACKGGGNECAFPDPLNGAAGKQRVAHSENDQKDVEAHLQGPEVFIVTSGSIFYHTLSAHYHHIGPKLDDHGHSLHKATGKQDGQTHRIAVRMDWGEKHHVDVDESREEKRERYLHENLDTVLAGANSTAYEPKLHENNRDVEAECGHAESKWRGERKNVVERGYRRGAQRGCDNQ